MFNLFSLFSSKHPHKKTSSTVPPDMAISLVMKSAKKLEDFNDDDSLTSKIDNFAKELDEIASVQEKMSYDDAVAVLKRLDEHPAS